MSGNLLEGDLGHVGGLDFLADTDELLLDVVLGGGDQHLLLDLGGVRGPDDEEDLGALASVLGLKKERKRRRKKKGGKRDK